MGKAMARKGITVRLGAALAAAGLLLGAAAYAQESAALHVAKGSRLWLDGDSTLHKFSVEATQLQVRFTTDQVVNADTKAADLETLVKAGGVKGLVLTVPVTKLNSGESGLDDNLVKALKGKEYPQITFRMESYEVVAAPKADFGLKLHGKLTISGTERPADLDLAATKGPNGALHVVGSKDLLMTDFKVPPPVLMMGMIKVKDQISVKFDLQLQAGP